MTHKVYKNILHDLTQIMGNGELDSNQLTQMCKAVFKKEFNSVCAWSEYLPNPKKPFSIVNTDDTVGSHWLGVYCDENGKDVYVYDSFARNLKRIMKDWYALSKKLNFKLILVNKKKDQSDASKSTPAQINCGIRSFIFIYCVKMYGIKQARNI